MAPQPARTIWMFWNNARGGKSWPVSDRGPLPMDLLMRAKHVSWPSSLAVTAFGA
jgi:hypothetical protein